eukprot:scaffold521_cov167-Amphora_coffeaeformis.AAC.18
MALHGIVVDWGCGGGVLALLAAVQPKVKIVIGLDYDAQNISTCRLNARQNGLEQKTKFFRSDWFQPLEEENKDELLKILQEKVDFVIANPPASSSDDGFSFRRRILQEATQFLKPHGHVILQALSYYGPTRFILAAEQAADWYNHQQQQPKDDAQTMRYEYQGVIKASPWLELGSGPGGYDFEPQLDQYRREEERVGRMRYYCGPTQTTAVNKETISVASSSSSSSREDQPTAVQAMAIWEETKIPPLCQWHMHGLLWKPQKVST